MKPCKKCKEVLKDRESNYYSYCEECRERIDNLSEEEYRDFLEQIS